MPALSFKEYFSPKVLTGIKQGTIRNVRKNPIKPGDTLYLYQEQRTKKSRKLGEALCDKLYEITINHDAIVVTPWGTKRPRLIEKLNDLNDFAVADGFEDWEHMRRWWAITHSELPWTGVWIVWKNFKPTRHE